MNESDFQAAVAGAIHTNFHGAELSILGTKHPAPHFRFLTGDINFTTYGGSWVSRAFNNGEFDYYLVIELRNCREDSGKETGATYEVSLSVVSPDRAGEHLAEAFESGGLPEELRGNKYVEVEALYTYGISVRVWHGEGNNWRKLVTAAHRQALFVNSFLGFYLDEPVNRIGNTGWDFLAGDIGFKF